VRFEATLTVPAVDGMQQIEVDAFAENHHDRVAVPVVIDAQVAPPHPPPWTTSPLASAGALPPAARLTAIAKPVGCELWWIGADGAVTGMWADPGTSWQSYPLAGPGSAAPSGGITAVSKGADVMEVWWIGPDGSVQAAWHDSGATWNPYTLAGPGSAAVTGSITGVFKGADAMEVWWIGPDGSVQAAWHDSGAAWNPYTLAGPGSASTSGSLTAVAKGGDAMEVWWIGPDGSVQASWHDSGSTWNPYVLAGAGTAASTGGITAVFKGADAMEVWWTGLDGSVQAAWHDSGATWNPYTLAGPGSASPSCRVSSAYGGSQVINVMRVWWVDPAGSTFQAFYDSEWGVTQIGAGAEPSGATIGVLFNPDTPTALWALPDGSLVEAFPPEITLSALVSGGRGLRGTVWLTLRQDGSTAWRGDVTNDEPYGYNFALSVFAQTGTSADIGAAHHGHVAGWAEPGSSNDIWREEHPANHALAAGLAGYRFARLSLKLEDSVDLIDYLEAAVDAIFETAVGLALGPIAGVVLIGVEIGSLIATGSLVPGAIIAGGIPWLAGPGGILLRAVLTAADADSRQLSDEEYVFVNDAVFRGCLPPIDSFKITNVIGAEDRPFTFPTLLGPTLVNVGDAIFADIHVNQPVNPGEPTIIHELVHVCQIAHSHDVAFTASGIVAQIKDHFEKHGNDDPAYHYGAAGFDYTDLGLEAQAQVVEDWFLGHAAKPQNPDPTNHTNKPMDALSPYYRYITDNLRTGRF
jgi:hypothetical protein